MAIPNNFNTLDMLNALSLLVGLQNLQENREQSAHNDVQLANDQQAREMLAQIRTMFEEQNAMLRTILQRLEDNYGNT